MKNLCREKGYIFHNKFERAETSVLLSFICNFGSRRDFAFLELEESPKPIPFYLEDY